MFIIDSSNRIQHAFENLEDSAKDGIIDELLIQGASVFSEVAKNQWGSYCVQHSKLAFVYICPRLLSANSLSPRAWF